MENIVLNYKLSYADVFESMTVIEKQEGKGKKQYIYSGLFILLAVLFFFIWFSNRENFINMFIALFCLSATALLWYLPVKNKKTVSKLTEEANEIFYMEFSSDKIFFCEDRSDFLDLENGIYYETKNVFVIDAGNEKIFCLPKKYCEEEKIRNILKNYRYKCLEENK